jgi:Na+-driven multidrug efflux pump
MRLVLLECGFNGVFSRNLYFIGNAIGEKNFPKAKRQAAFGSAVGISISLFYMGFLAYYKEQWACYYSGDEGIQ